MLPLSPDDAKKRLMLALDFDNREKAEEWVHKMKMHVGFFKVGLQLFTLAGPELVRSIRARGGRVFLDVKYHDIPTTVALACKGACALGIDFINVHALGGKAMMRAAAEALREASTGMRVARPKLLAVTILTSHDARSLKAEVGLRGGPDQEVLRLAKMAKDCGADGVVCSPKEIAAVRKACGKDFLIVTPGIRGASQARQDQKRTLSAGQAVSRGADYVVVGRPITAAADPVEAAKAMTAEIQAATTKKGVKK
ncbi:MAG: orotidine-5'-phosphate decarboxylase [candidate division FCPU426 bacterium]